MTGVSGDTKPDAGSLITGTTFHETDTDDLYIWDGDSWNIVASNTGAETLSNKTFGNHITIAEISAPSTPSSGYGAIYAKSDNKLYFKNDAGTEVDLTNQASGGETNQNAWNTITVSGQDNVVADSATDTLTLVGGTNVTITTNASNDTVTFAASGSGTVTITDNESTNENNLITFVADAATSTGAHGLEMDGNLYYNPSTGTVTATVFAGNLTGDVTGDVSGTAATVTGATQAAITTAANLVSVGALDSGSITSGFTSIDVGSGAITTSGTITAGNLVVNGTTSTINSTTVTVDDPIFTLGGDSAPSSDDNKDRGIEFRWHNGSAAKVGFFGYDDSAGKMTFIPDATNNSEVFSGTAGTIVANLEGSVTGNADTVTNGVYTTGNQTIGGTKTFSSTITGNISGTAATVTGGTQASITSAANLVTVGTIGTGVWQGTAIAQTYIADQAINEAKLQVSNNPTNGYVLSAQSGNAGGMTWIAAGAGEANEYAFKTIAISGQNNVVADTTTDTLTLVAGTNMTLTTSGDSITFAASGSSGASESFAIAMAVAL